MREPFPFQLLMKLELELVEAAMIEVKQLTNWGSNKSNALSDSRRKSVALRSNKFYPKTGIGQANMIDTCVDTDNIKRAKKIMGIVTTVREAMNWTSKLGLVSVSVLSPGGLIKPHIDGGAYFSYYHRVQIPLSAGPGITFSCEDETIEMKLGEVWCLDNKRVHWVNNSSAVHDRVNLFFDTR